MKRSKHATYGSLYHDVIVLAKELAKATRETADAEDALDSAIKVYEDECRRHSNTMRTLRDLHEHHTEQERKRLESDFMPVVDYSEPGVSFIEYAEIPGSEFRFSLRCPTIRMARAPYAREVLQSTVEKFSREIADKLVASFMAKFHINVKEIDGIDSRFRY